MSFSCIECGRELTNDVSIIYGHGPECFKMISNYHLKVDKKSIKKYIEKQKKKGLRNIKNRSLSEEDFKEMKNCKEIVKDYRLGGQLKKIRDNDLKSVKNTIENLKFPKKANELQVKRLKNKLKKALDIASSYLKVKKIKIKKVS